jgi:hypothetical protein
MRFLLLACLVFPTFVHAQYASFLEVTYEDEPGYTYLSEGSGTSTFTVNGDNSFSIQNFYLPGSSDEQYIRFTSPFNSAIPDGDVVTVDYSVDITGGSCQIGLFQGGSRSSGEYFTHTSSQARTTSEINVSGNVTTPGFGVDRASGVCTGTLTVWEISSATGIIYWSAEEPPIPDTSMLPDFLQAGSGDQTVATAIDNLTAAMNENHTTSPITIQNISFLILLLFGAIIFVGILTNRFL